MVIGFKRKTNNSYGYTALTFKNKFIIAIIFCMLFCFGGLVVLAALRLEDGFGFFGFGHHVVSDPNFLVGKMYRASFITLFGLVGYMIVCSVGIISVNIFLKKYGLCTPDEAWDAVIFLRFPDRFCSTTNASEIKKIDPWFGPLHRVALYMFFFIFILDLLPIKLF